MLAQDIFWPKKIMKQSTGMSVLFISTQYSDYHLVKTAFSRLET